MKVKINFLKEPIKAFEINKRDDELINIINKNKSSIHKNKKKYNRKIKHKTVL